MFSNDRAEDSPYVRSRIKLLLVADEQRDGKRIRRMLANVAASRFEVALAGSAEFATRVRQGERPEAVLLDLAVCAGRGIDPVLRAAVASCPAPILAMVSEDDERRALRALRLGVQDYVVKWRFDGQHLARALQRLIEQHRSERILQGARRREHFLATHDGVTGLPNFASFTDQLDRSLARAERTGRRLALLFLDVDGFERINAALGHAAGDQTLSVIGGRINALVRWSDMVARVSGDQFVVLIEDVQRDHAPARVAQGLIERVAVPLRLGSHEHRLGASVGISIFPRDARDPEVLIRTAKAAMREAKAQGGGCFRLHAGPLDVAVSRALELDRRLRRAVERHELCLHYQPVREVGSGRLSGAEALLRWTDEELGPVSPAEFIPIAEETELINPINEWVLRTACAQAEAWQRAGFRSIRIAMNVSARHEILVRAIPRILRENRMSSRWLELDITESIVLDGQDSTIAALQEAHEMGVGLVLDEFGTGLSSLSCLRLLPIDRLKIDRSFVAKITTDSSCRSLSAAIIAMAHGLGLPVVAVGVERLEQADLLREQRCDELQGNLLSPPLPADGFERFLEREKPD